MTILFSNNATSTLANTLAVVDLTLVLASGGGTRFPSPAGNNVFYLTVENVSGDFEICRCTARTADILTIVRAQDGTAAQEFTAGSRVELRASALVMSAMTQNADLAARALTAGQGLSGGGNFSASVTFNVGAGTGITVGADDVGLDTANTRNVDHSAVSVTAGDGLTGGGTLAATRTLAIDLPGLPAMSVDPVGTDGFMFDDGGTLKRAAINDLAIPNTDVAATHVFVSTNASTSLTYTGSTVADAWAMNIDIGKNGQVILIINDGGSAGPTLTSGTATLESATGNLVVKQNGMVVLVRRSASLWKVSGDLQA